MSTTDKEATELIHLSYDGNFQLETDARVILCKVIINDESSTNKIDDEKNVEKDSGDGDSDNVIRVELQLDKTSMHPQGGGQPTDVGVITLQHHSTDSDDDNDSKDCATVAKIDKVTIDRSTGIVTHSGTVLTKTAKNNNNNDAAAAVCDDLFPPNSSVTVNVDAYNRTLLSECHTAGHVVDAAMAKCNKLLPPTKGYHFLDGPYVEYKGTIDAADRDEFLSQLKEVYQQLINEDIHTQIQTLSVDEAEERCNRLAKNFNMKDFTDTTDENPSVRVVAVAGWNCPCGGTHVKSTGLLKERGWCVKGLKCKKGVVVP
ncbi:hypothetical protein ACHAWC_002259 [Mediolabrus comicus]